MRIALAEDEQDLREQLAAIVVAGGHDIEVFANGKSLQTALKRDTYDVVLLDWNMPGLTGLDVLNWAAEHMECPPAFIMITSRSATDDVVRALEAGAVDYIIKPEADEIIRARLEAAGRRIGFANSEARAEFGKYVLDRKAKTIEFDGEAIAVTAKEFDLADLMFQNVDKPLSRAYLFARVWGSDVELETRTIDVHISRLRSKLKLEPGNGFVVRTVFGFGYRMDGYIDTLTAVE